MFKDEKHWDSETTGSHCQTRVKPEFEPCSAGFHTLSNQAVMILAQNRERTLQFQILTVLNTSCKIFLEIWMQRLWECQVGQTAGSLCRTPQNPMAQPPKTNYRAGPWEKLGRILITFGPRKCFRLIEKVMIFSLRPCKRNGVLHKQLEQIKTLLCTYVTNFHHPWSLYYLFPLQASCFERFLPTKQSEFIK